MAGGKTLVVIPVLLAAASLSSALAADLCAEGLALEDVGSIVNYYIPQRLTLQAEKPEALQAEPTYEGTPRYAALKMGDGADSIITVAVDEKLAEDGTGTRRIYIDANNDNDLTNDGDGAWRRESAQSLMTEVTVKTFYAGDGGGAAVDYRIALSRLKDQLPDQILYYRRSARVGELKIGDQQYKVALVDDNTNGLYNDLAPAQGQRGPGVTLVIDRDQDGTFVPDFGGPEVFAGHEPFCIAGTTYELDQVSPAGESFTIRVSDEVVAERAYIIVGRPAPEIDASDIDGKPIKLSDYRGRVVLIDFWATWCGPCRQEMPKVIAAYNELHEKGFDVLGISLDEGDEGVAKLRQYIGENGMPWRQICDRMGWECEWAKLYGVTGIPTQLLIDQEGIIRHKVIGAERLDLAQAVRDLLSAD
ncbi:MAG TPA: TlpA disulfide reductase family protein [Armatimonadota bacterium]|nr:TlpA disulfide reductase family protein [Armatimonadota bacterium]